MVIDERAYLIIDIFVISLMIFCIVKGVIDGFLYELINVLFLFVALFIAWLISPICANSLPLFDIKTENDLLNLIADVSNLNAVVNNILWFIILVFVILIVFLVIRPLLKKICKIPLFGNLNRILGGLFGVIYGFILVLLFTVFLTLPIFKNGKQAKDNTILKYTDKASKFTTKFLLNNVNLDSIKQNVSNFDADEARKDLYDLLINQGILDE